MSLQVYRSAAGSGKTFTLVKEYLIAAFSSKLKNGSKQILALTFTNKAATEMKERIIKTLVNFSDPKNNESDDMMHQILSDSPALSTWNESDLRKRSQELLQEILLNYYSFSVSTIDKFNQKLIRTFASDLQLSQNFEVELDVDQMLQEAVEKVISLAQAGKNTSELTKYLTDFTLHEIGDDKSWKISRTLFKFSKVLIEENSAPYLKQLEEIDLTSFQSIIKSNDDFVKEFENGLLKRAKKGIDFLDENELADSDFKGKSTGIQAFFSSVYFKKKYTNAPTDKQVNFMESQDLFAVKLSKERRNFLESLSSEIESLFIDLQHFQSSGLSQYIISKYLKRSMYSLGLIKHLQIAFNSIKVERNVIPISDFNRLISEVVAEEPAPFIYERVGNNYTTFLIDEFQDTSKLQWRNLIPLFEDSLGKGGNNLIVGDGKQAIYRWRGGDVDQFVYMFNKSGDSLLNHRLQNMKQHYREKLLDTNYRSHGEIVQFNNDIFSSISASKDQLVKDIYAECIQKKKEEKEKGYVRIELWQKEKAWNDQYGQQTENEWLTWDEYNLSKLCDMVEELRSKNYNYDEIAILARTGTQLKKAAMALTDKGVPIVSAEALLIFNDRSVQLFHAFLHLSCEMNNPNMRVKVFFLLQELGLLGVDIHELLDSIVEKGGRGSNNFQKILNKLGFELNMTELKNKSVLETCRLILKGLKLGEEANPYLEAYLNHLYTRETKYNWSTLDFLEFIEEKKDNLSIEQPEGPNAVQLLTIHKAKGLEFPAVIVPFASKKMNNDDNIWVPLDKEKHGLSFGYLPVVSALENTDVAVHYYLEKSKMALDEINVWYVAFTRAVETLLVISEENPQSNYSASLFVPNLRGLAGYDEENMSFERGAYDALRIPKIRLEQKNFHPNKMTVTQNLSQINLQEIKVDSVKEHDDERRYGNMLHLFMSTIQTKDIKLIPHQVSTFGQKQGLNNDELERIEKDCISLLHHPNIGNLFSTNAEVKTEAKLLDDNKNILIPDRVVIDGKKAKVLDYKTGLKSSNHQDQVVAYKSALRNMGYENVQGFLYYTQHKELVEV